MLTCVLCKNWILGSYYTNHWGQNYCSRHGSDKKHCEACHRVFLSSDRGTLCAGCQSTAITSSAQIPDLWRAVNQFLFDKLGIDIRSSLPADAVSLATAEQLRDASTCRSPNLRGLAITYSTTTIFGVSVFSKSRVLIKRGLPRTLAGGILAHECFHVYSAKQNLKLSRLLEEGTANLLAYLWLKQYDSEVARVFTQSLMDNTDPIYGEGFRQVRLTYKKLGSFSKLIDHLKKGCSHA